ncbi:MAG: TauD/TfdA family dioxygenase [Nocardioides sp.]|uniref:TauD/TfdA family dioxygenase n=1 Tax=Nocardioides sp. TaxID=35761 RepID=UPI0039E46377
MMRVIETELSTAERAALLAGEPAENVIAELAAMRAAAPDRPEVLIVHSVDDVSDDAIRDLGRAVSSGVGSFLVQDSAGSLDRDVIERAVSGPARFSETAAAAPMHTDGMHMPDQPTPGYFSLTCLNSARRGGALSFVHIDDVLDGFTEPDHAVRTLREPFYFHTKGVDPHGREWVVHPVLDDRRDGGHHVRYAREYIDMGHALSDAPDLAATAVSVLDELDDILSRGDLHRRARLRRGDVAVIDNEQVLHSRTAFENAAGDPPRCLMRLWLQRP